MPSRSYTRKQSQREERETDRLQRGVAASARARFTGVAPRKAMFVADMIRGLPVSQAMEALRFTHRPSAGPVIERLLKAALAAVNRQEHSDPESLRVATIQVDSAGMMKRFQPRAFGRAARIRKRMSHITVELADR